MASYRIPLVTLALVATAGCAPSLDLEAERASLREAAASYVTLANAGDEVALAALYAPDATQYPPNGDPVTGPSGIAAWANRIASTPGFHLEPRPLELTVSESGDVGYTLEALELTVTGPDGEPMVQHLRDFHVWKKQGDGSWKIAVDIWHNRTFPDVPGGS